MLVSSSSVMNSTRFALPGRWRTSTRPAASSQRHARDGLCRADRLGKGPTRFDAGIGPDRFDRFGDPANRLVRTPAELDAEAQRQGRARLSKQVADLIVLGLALPRYCARAFPR